MKYQKGDKILITSNNYSGHGFNIGIEATVLRSDNSLRCEGYNEPGKRLVYYVNERDCCHAIVKYELPEDLFTI